ncbi:Lactation elevated protein 1 [Hordeum vulgare]|nr:Lactation elevated protein 1 [Hordeum vulgare]
MLARDKNAQQRYKDMEASKDKKFKLEHCWDMLKECDKWKLIPKESPSKRGSLMNMDEDEDDDGPRNFNKPDVKTLEPRKELAKKKAREKQEKWQLLKDEGLRKTVIEERRARAAENKAMSKLLFEENTIMTLNHNDMDDITKE